MLNLKNIIIFGVVGIAIVLVYVFLFKKDPAQANLASSSPIGQAPTTPLPRTDTTSSSSIIIGKDFLSLLLNVKNIKLDDSIFTDPVFITLHDSSIELNPDGTEGRENPFAPIGIDSTTTSTPSPNPNTEVVPPASSPYSSATSVPPKTQVSTPVGTNPNVNTNIKPKTSSSNTGVPPIPPIPAR